MLAVRAVGDMTDPCSQAGGTSGEKEFKKVQKNWPREEWGKKVWETALETRGGGGGEGGDPGNKAENPQRSLPALGGDNGGASIHTAVHGGPHPVKLDIPEGSCRYEESMQ